MMFQAVFTLHFFSNVLYSVALLAKKAAPGGRGKTIFGQLGGEGARGRGGDGATAPNFLESNGLLFLKNGKCDVILLKQ